jgi:hypothetical protein
MVYLGGQPLIISQEMHKPAFKVGRMCGGQNLVAQATNETDTLGPDTDQHS